MTKYHTLKQIPVILSALCLFLCTNLLAAPTYQINNVLELNIDSSINPATENYVKDSLASNKDYDLLLIKLNTPGGLVSTTKNLITTLGKIDKPTVVWVTPEGASATSAGAILSSAAHFVFMSPGTNMGAATPIQLSGDIDKKSDARKKAINDLTSLVKSLSEARGRNPQPIIKMISEAKSLSAQEGLEKKFIDKIASNKEDIFNFMNKKEILILGNPFEILVSNPKVKSVEMDIGQALLNTFANPNTAYILFLIGAALLYLEFQSPGGFIAGSVGAVALILSGIGFQVLPINMGALLLLVSAFVLFIIEIYITSYGILSIAGLAAMISGSLFLYRTDDSMMQIGFDVILSSVLAIVVFLLFIFWIISRDHKFIGKEKFNEHTDKEATIIKIKKVGDKYHYQIKIQGEFWQAISKNEYEINQVVKVKNKVKHELIYEI